MAATTMHSLPQGAVPSNWFAPTFGAPSLKRPGVFKANFSMGDDTNKLYTAPQGGKRMKIGSSSKIPIPFTPRLPKRANVALRPAATNGMYHVPSPEAVAAYGDQLETESRLIGYDVQPHMETVETSFGVRTAADQMEADKQAAMNAHFKGIENAVADAAKGVENAVQQSADQITNAITTMDNDLTTISAEIASNTANANLRLDAVNENLGNLTEAILHPPQPELNDADRAGGILSTISKITGAVAGFAAFVPGIGTAVAIGLGAVSAAAGAGAAISKTVSVKQKGGSDLAATGEFFSEAAQTISNVAPAVSKIVSNKQAAADAKRTSRENMSNQMAAARAASGMTPGSVTGGNGNGGGGSPGASGAANGVTQAGNVAGAMSNMQGITGTRPTGGSTTPLNDNQQNVMDALRNGPANQTYTPAVIDQIMSTPLPGTGPGATPPSALIPPQYTPGAGVRPRAGSGGTSPSGGLMAAFNEVASPQPTPRTNIRNYLSTFPTSPYVSRLGSLGTLKGLRNIVTKQNIKDLIRGGTSTMPANTPRGRRRTTRPGDQYVADIPPNGGFMF